MEPRSLARSVLAISELREHTVDFLSNSRADLHSCALVSKSWVPRAQYHIFGEIILSQPLNGSVMKLLRRLTETLEASPHIAHYIRHLSISLNIGLLEGLAEMTLPSLQELTVMCTSSRLLDETRFLVQSLLRRPTIRGVALHGSFPSISVIGAYFDNCAHIQRLGLMMATVEDSDSLGFDFECRKFIFFVIGPDSLIVSHERTVGHDQLATRLSWSIRLDRVAVRRGSAVIGTIRGFIGTRY
ncbi:hypothetical protein C8R45DRAFT_961759 [Mycena sanguinolenta]|nr:hypothetical protein C8R45DRAFT_961759 [Mycena sanguinolenta]